MTERSIIRWVWGLIVALLIGSMAIAGFLASQKQQSIPQAESAAVSDYQPVSCTYSWRQ